MAQEQILELVECDFDATQSTNNIGYEVRGLRECPVSSQCNHNDFITSHHTIKSKKYESVKAQCTALKHYCPKPNPSSLQRRGFDQVSFKSATPLDLLPPNRRQASFASIS